MSKLRIDKIFSNLGILSRTECKAAVKRGDICVNGIRVIRADEKSDPDADVITYKGRQLDTKTFVYYMLNKPAGYITANDDKHSKTVFDLVPDTRTDLSAVGRLDKDTTGILLITNNGEINHRLLSPKFHVPKTYELIADGSLTGEDVALLERGIDIGDEKPTLPAKCAIIDNNPPARIELTITEGRFHQVKRMFEAIGKPVLKLHRKSFGPLVLDEMLDPGELRPLSPEEESAIFSAAGIPCATSDHTT